LTGDAEEPPKKAPAKKAQTGGKASKSSGMIAIDESSDEDDVF